MQCPPSSGKEPSPLLWGVKFYKDLLMQADQMGNVQLELIFQKDQATFTFEREKLALGFGARGDKLDFSPTATRFLSAKPFLGL